MKTLMILLMIAAGATAFTKLKSGRAVTGSSIAREETAVFAGGCYWCMDAAFEKLSGLKNVISGYAVGEKDGMKSTVKVEAIKVIFDPSVTSYQELLEYYWKQFDPTDAGGSFHDRGPQYESYIFYQSTGQKSAAEKSKVHLESLHIFKKPIVTGIVKFKEFIPVGESEQHFYRKDPERYYSYRRASGRDDFIRRVWGDAYTEKYKKPGSQELMKKLSPLEYEVTQKGGTEMPFTNKYVNNHKEGIYVDIVSGEPLFSSTDKYNSGSGWPSFTKPIDPYYLVKNQDNSGGMARVEIQAKGSGSHLGHVFNDGPEPTNLRYCIDSAALRFIPKDELAKEGYGEFAYLFK